MIEGNDGQQGVASEGEIQSGFGPSMPVTILLPCGGVPFVMIAIFDRPVLAHGSGGACFFFRVKAGEEDTCMALQSLFGIALASPIASHEHHGTGAGQSCAHRRDGGEGGFAGVYAPVFGFGAQAKRGAFFTAPVAAANRAGVFSLVPMR